MTRRSLAERIPAHLGCALTTLCFVALGASASCDRRADASRPNTPSSAAAVPPAPVVSEPPTLVEVSPRNEGATAAETSAKREEPTVTAPAGPPRRYVIAALGDSITDKRGGGGGYLSYLSARCPESVIDNYGKGGDMTNQMRRRFEADLLPVARERGYTHLIVFGGVNDLYSDLTAGRVNERIESDLSAIYAQATQARMEVIAITVAPWGGFKRFFDARRGENTRRLNSWIFAQRDQRVVRDVVDAYALLSCGDPERLCPEYEPPFHDGLHPGAKGHEVLGKALHEQAFKSCR